MKNALIEFKSITDNKDLVAIPTYEAIMNWNRKLLANLLKIGKI